VTGLFFVQRMRSRAVISMVTYITENVSGLDISSPVRFRGVSVGRVTDLPVDPIGKSIENEFEVFQDRLVSIGANVKSDLQIADLAVFPQLRTRVVSNPVTGDAYLLLDLPSPPPPPVALGFIPNRPYVASMPSPLAVVQDRLPDVLERAEQTLQTLREIVSRIPDSLDRSDRFFTNVERIIRDTQLPQLSADSRMFFATTTARMTQIAADMNQLTGTEGSLVKFAEEARVAIRDADVPGSTQSARDALDRTSLAADDLRRSLPAIQDALEQLRELARRLDEQPESVVYGPRQPASKSR
jgi:paraquat-inducible protein B